jgi:hypothetical protein
MITTIKCPKCGEEIEISKALSHEAEDLIAQKIEKKIREESELKIKDSENEKEELRIKNKEFQNQILELSKSIRKLSEDNEIKTLKEKEIAREEGAKFEKEKQELEKAELNKKIEDMRKALEDAQNKAKQGSQQLQGEVLELNLENKLRDAFIYDEIEPIGKGVEGGDIVQKVKNQTGKQAGIILWETKRAKWTPSWLPKLREDGRKFDATLVVLVSTTLPKEIESFEVMDNVIVTSYKHAIPLASILRLDVMRIANAKLVAANKDEKLENLYQYLQSEAFRARFESFTEGVIEMQDDLLTEKRSMERVWKKRETQIQRTIGNIGKMYGELQGIMGKSLPTIKKLELPED